MTATTTNLKAQVQIRINAATSETSLKDLMILRLAAFGLDCNEANLDTLVTAKLEAMGDETALQELMMGSKAVGSGLSGFIDGQMVWLPDSFPADIQTDHGRFLRSGYVETDTSKFDTGIFTAKTYNWQWRYINSAGNAPRMVATTGTIIDGYLFYVANEETTVDGETNKYLCRTDLVSYETIRHDITAEAGLTGVISNGCSFLKFDGGYLFLMPGTKVFYSAEGTEWTQSQITYSSGSVNGMYPAAVTPSGVFYSTGTASSTIYRIAGIEENPTSEQVLTGFQIRGMRYVNGNIVGLGTTGNVFARPHASGSFTSRGLVPASASIADLVFFNNLYVLVTSQGLIYTSSDMAAWTLLVTFSTATSPTLAVYNDTLFFFDGARTIRKTQNLSAWDTVVVSNLSASAANNSFMSVSSGVICISQGETSSSSGARGIITSPEAFQFAGIPEEQRQGTTVGYMRISA